MDTIQNVETYGFNASIRAMRNPKDSWGLSDSYSVSRVFHTGNAEGFVLGEKDMILSQKLSNAGSEHCKHLRFIQVWADITLPRYVWTECDTYKYFEKISCQKYCYYRLY